ncbi:MAG: bifunctional diaminohydroxyphosphoribosylaminopyrimidine deaminase/5-amino-6-(5-phosphoribosylamino)uracil reductase RibD [Bacteroidetes bacterium]|nr:MAG: bifunctional diaminohydroxyphosphoribosylaminopyrimidine deaminase/5-amino-6-(5-phosphoribosylamino)uracil reductase RibD [Bacteroidota bacterium]
MRRCFDLALQGAGSVSPNPMVGAVVVYENTILGEGWHRQFGGPHAEVNAIASVPPEHQTLLPHSTLYCSLEPCFHHGKTPPCVDLILEHRIPRVVISTTDPNPKVAGQSVEKLRAAGVEVITGVLEAEGRWLNRAFFTWITRKRPYIILKWAQSADGIIAHNGQQTAISGALTQRLVHRWRSEVDAILVGTTTALTDNPRLDNRLYFGRPPLRIALDWNSRIAAKAHLLDDSMPTWILGPEHPGKWTNTVFQNINQASWVINLLEKLRAEGYASLLVEGGARIHQQFLDADLWDEIRIIENPVLLGNGVAAPDTVGLGAMENGGTFPVGDDRVQIWLRKE